MFFSIVGMVCFPKSISKSLSGNFDALDIAIPFAAQEASLYANALPAFELGIDFSLRDRAVAQIIHKLVELFLRPHFAKPERPVLPSNRRVIFCQNV